MTKNISNSALRPHALTSATAVELLDLFLARTGIVTVVGAGGKKTTIYRLATAHRGRVGVTSTVMTPPFRPRLHAHVVVEDPGRLTDAVVDAARQHQRVAFATPSQKRARLGGVAPSQVTEIYGRAGFDLCLVKGDGARLKWIKAPGDEEPVVPPSTVVVPVVSARALGAPLTAKTVHRVELFCRLTGAQNGETITPEIVARLLSSELGLLKNIGAARVVAAINMVDTRQRRVAAQEAAQRALELSPRIERVVLARMIADDPVVEVVRR